MRGPTSVLPREQHTRFIRRGERQLMATSGEGISLTVGPSGSIEAYPRGRLLYLPTIPPGPAEPTKAFGVGESLEFLAEDYQGAAAAFRAPSAAVRAGALPAPGADNYSEYGLREPRGPHHVAVPPARAARPARFDWSVLIEQPRSGLRSEMSRREGYRWQSAARA